MKKILQASTLYFAFLAGSALAQSQIDVPFDFQAGGEPMPAGRYLVRPATLGSSGPFFLQHRPSGKMVLVATPVPMVNEKWTKRRLVFDCQSGCELTEVWAHPGTGGARSKPAPVTVAAR